MSQFSIPILHERLYRTVLLVSDFTRHRTFNKTNTKEEVTLSYIGDSVKFFSPSDIANNPAKALEAISWLSSIGNINVMYGDTKGNLSDLEMPLDYYQGMNGQIQECLYGFALISKLLNGGAKVTPNDIINSIMSITLDEIQRKYYRIGKNIELQLVLHIYESTVYAIRTPSILSYLQKEMRLACNYVNTGVIAKNIPIVLSKEGSYRIMIGNTRTSITNKVAFYQKINGTYKELRLDNAIKEPVTLKLQKRIPTTTKGKNEMRFIRS